eukprot:gene9674-20117_t
MTFVNHDAENIPPLTPIRIEPAIILFKDVSNFSSIHDIFTQNIIEGCSIDVSYIASYFHIQVAVHKAQLNEAKGALKTKSLMTEILYQLSPSTKFNDSIARYTPTDTSTHIAIVITNPSIDNLDRIRSAIIGTEISMGELETMLDDEKRQRISKYFKFTAQELSICSLDSAICTKISTKDIL